jgi:hypothetical protein
LNSATANLILVAAKFTGIVRDALALTVDRSIVAATLIYCMPVCCIVLVVVNMTFKNVALLVRGIAPFGESISAPIKMIVVVGRCDTVANMVSQAVGGYLTATVDNHIVGERGELSSANETPPLHKHFLRFESDSDIPHGVSFAVKYPTILYFDHVKFVVALLLRQYMGPHGAINIVVALSFAAIVGIHLAFVYSPDTAERQIDNMGECSPVLQEYAVDAGVRGQTDVSVLVIKDVKGGICLRDALSDLAFSLEKVRRAVVQLHGLVVPNMHCPRSVPDKVMEE